jgi:hypothetical protein
MNVIATATIAAAVAYTIAAYVIWVEATTVATPRKTR